MAFNTISITPAIANTATLHANVSISDAMDDGQPIKITITLTENNFGLPYGNPQTFSVASGVNVTAPNNQLIAFASGEINAATPQRLTNAVLAFQDVVKAIKKTSGALNVAPRG